MASISPTRRSSNLKKSLFIQLPFNSRKIPCRATINWSISGGVTIRGGAKRRIVSWVQLIRNPFSRQASTTGFPGKSSARPRSSPRPRTSFTTGNSVCQRLQPLLKISPHLPDPVQKSRFQEDRQHRQSRGANQVVPAEGGRMRPRDKGPGRFIAGQQGPDGQTVAQGLGQGHQVGFDPELFVGKQGPRAAEPGLHLVQDQQGFPLPTSLPGPLSKNRLPARAPPLLPGWAPVERHKWNRPRPGPGPPGRQRGQRQNRATAVRIPAETSFARWPRGSPWSGHESCFPCRGWSFSPVPKTPRRSAGPA